MTFWWIKNDAIFARDNRYRNNDCHYRILTINLNAFFFSLGNLECLFLAFDAVKYRGAEQQVCKEQHQQDQPLLLGHSRMLPAKCWNLAWIRYSQGDNDSSDQVIIMSKRRSHGYVFLTWFSVMKLNTACITSITSALRFSREERLSFTVSRTNRRVDYHEFSRGQCYHTAVRYLRSVWSLSADLGTTSSS